MDRTDPEHMFDPEINFVVGKKQLGKIIDKCINKHGFTKSAGMLDASSTASGNSSAGRRSAWWPPAEMLR